MLSDRLLLLLKYRFAHLALSFQHSHFCLDVWKVETEVLHGTMVDQGATSIMFQCGCMRASLWLGTIDTQKKLKSNFHGLFYLAFWWHFFYSFHFYVQNTNFIPQILFVCVQHCDLKKNIYIFCWILRLRSKPVLVKALPACRFEKRHWGNEEMTYAYPHYMLAVLKQSA